MESDALPLSILSFKPLASSRLQRSSGLLKAVKACSMPKIAHVAMKAWDVG